MQTTYKTTASITVEHRKGQEPAIDKLAAAAEFAVSLELATEESENMVGKAEITGVAIAWDQIHKDEPTPVKPICTVNVLEIGDTNDMSVQYMASFIDNEDGNTEAEKIFRTKILDQNEGQISDEDMDTHIENGYYQQGDYYIALVHNTLAPNEA